MKEWVRDGLCLFVCMLGGILSVYLLFFAAEKVIPY